ncbi:sugar phosphate isomerase/epimerase [Rhizobium sp. TRM95796]|uniref:sugar phosphate isomerase/epimerase n=1 Tax=Rhizobium sp. TRM95796 TaxID=2979862 RepID=UPI0021E7C509|nr:sugar phosphate isomerase/epimerase [Rhizobium sp. TRM95796]MCV3768212.1 sugar phosphate isomerase/epimerase [Rhizobium sp. TRM95796]
MSMALSSDQCTPYLSVSLYRATGDAVASSELLTAIRDLARDNADKKGTERARFPAVQDPSIESDGTTVAWAHYVEKRSPSWYVGEGVADTLNQLIIVASRGDLYALLFSDNGLRGTVAKKILRASNGPFSRIRRLSSSEINKAFVESQVRTLWLSGTHRRTAIKPDSKILSGLELETSLDPLGDQTYYFSSVRSTISLSEHHTSAVVGASPTGSRIWIGPTRSWEEFIVNVGLVLDRAADYMSDAARPDRPLPILASAITALDGIEQPYDLAFIVPEQVADGAGPAGEDELRWLQQFGDAARFEVTAAAGSANFEADVFWADERLGRLAYEFEQTLGSDVRLKIRKMDGFDNEARDADILKICRQPENITVYFDTGHTFSRGHFYETRFRDARFSDWRWVSMAHHGTAFWQEKPLDGKRFAVENIGNADDNSLFGMVARHWPNLEERGQQAGWLVCDDGAMESADFIHVNDTSDPPELTLIHVKGSGSNDANRGLSVSDYEVVVGQAIKNLRHVDRGLLREKLAANAEGVLQNAVWHDGQRQENREALLAMLAGLGSNLKTKVVVFQPRVRRSVFNSVRDKMDSDDPPDSEVRRMQQLDALLLGARSDCFSLGAAFVVIADADDE